MVQTGIDTSLREQLSGKVARVDRALATPWWHSRFGTEFDAAFATANDRHDREAFRFWLAMLALAQVLGLLRDSAFGLEQLGLLLRGVVVMPVVVGIILALEAVRARHLRELLSSLAVLTAIGAQILLAVLAPQPVSDRYLMGTVFAFSILHLVLPFSHRQIIAHSGLVGVVLGLAAWHCKGDGHTVVMDRLEVLLPGIILVAACGAMVMRHNKRRAYLMDLRSTLQAHALEDANRSLGQLLRQDTLTGVYNRRYFDETMDSLWQGLQRNGKACGLILLDVDHFKSFNDRLGHQAGDRCLKDVASQLSASLRESDFVVARYGGEEFAVILPGVTAAAVHAVGERLRKAVEDMGWPHPAGGVVTVSVGTAAAQPDACSGYHALIDAADRALYASKEAGRNCVTAGFVTDRDDLRVAAARYKVA